MGFFSFIFSRSFFYELGRGKIAFAQLSRGEKKYNLPRDSSSSFFLLLFIFSRKQDKRLNPSFIHENPRNRAITSRNYGREMALYHSGKNPVTCNCESEKERCFRERSYIIKFVYHRSHINPLLRSFVTLCVNVNVRSYFKKNLWIKAHTHTHTQAQAAETIIILRIWGI